MMQQKKSHQEAVDDWVTKLMQAQHIPSLSLAVVHQGETVFSKSYGSAHLELEVPATLDTVYQIGSVTKQFTATAIMMLVEDAKLALDESISCYQSDLPSSWGAVTVRHLLNHTSGIKSFTKLPNSAHHRTDQPVSREEILALVSGEPLDFMPGERYAYNNTGYYLLGHIIKQASGVPYAEFLQDRIFKPLAMTATRVNDMDDLIPHRANGYIWAENRWWNARPINMTWAFSAGALVSTAEDLARWQAALGTKALLSVPSWEQMWVPTVVQDGTPVEYGFGWRVGERNGHRLISHDGVSPGFTALAEWYPSDELAVVVLTNIVPGKLTEITQRIAGLYVEALLPT